MSVSDSCCYGDMTICVFLFHIVQQIASFVLPDTTMPPHLMKGHSSQVILLGSGSELVLFTIHGLQLAAFQDHQKPITSMWVVSVAPVPPIAQSPALGAHVPNSCGFSFQGPEPSHHLFLRPLLARLHVE